MNYTIQRCCTTPVFLKGDDLSAEAVAEKLGINITVIKEFNCCGYPLKNVDYEAHCLASARNMALAKKKDLDILTTCACCYGSLNHVHHHLKEDISARDKVNAKLTKEGIEWEESIRIKHFLEVLYQDIGIDKLKEQITKKFQGLKIALHYGCRILRPKDRIGFDPPGTKEVIDQLVKLTGAEIISWETQEECCGAPIWGVDDDLSMDLTQKKITDAKESGAEYLCVACPFCQIQFDRVQNILAKERQLDIQLPSILSTQLLGLSLGIDPDALGIQYNELTLDGIINRLGNLGTI